MPAGKLFGTTRKTRLPPKASPTTVSCPRPAEITALCGPPASRFHCGMV
ncbi:hypothetical protein NG798_05160 [Ancylothrix sp. C2]|nr:hypothetical protein [Ancylothrix sp. D3o]